jgi:hypothetical protein
MINHSHARLLTGVSLAVMMVTTVRCSTGAQPSEHNRATVNQNSATGGDANAKTAPNPSANANPVEAPAAAAPVDPAPAVATPAPDPSAAAPAPSPAAQMAATTPPADTPAPSPAAVIPQPVIDYTKFHIKVGTGKGPWNTAATPIILKVGDVLTIYNDDTVTHRMHTSGAPCPHGVDVAPGASTTCKIGSAIDTVAKPGQTYDHIVGPSALIFIQTSK